MRFQGRGAGYGLTKLTTGHPLDKRGCLFFFYRVQTMIRVCKWVAGRTRVFREERMAGLVFWTKSPGQSDGGGKVGAVDRMAGLFHTLSCSGALGASASDAHRSPGSRMRLDQATFGHLSLAGGCPIFFCRVQTMIRVCKGVARRLQGRCRADAGLERRCVTQRQGGSCEDARPYTECHELTLCW